MRRRLTWKAKLPLLLVLFSLGPLSVIGGWADVVLEDTFEEATLRSMNAIARSEADGVERFTEDRKRQVERIAQLVSPRVVAVLEAEREEPVRAPVGHEEAAPLPALEDAEGLSGGGERPQPSPSNGGASVDEPLAPQHEEAAGALVEATDALRHTLGLILWDQREFEELLVLDVDGRVVVSTFQGHEGRTAAELAYFQGGLRTTHVQPIFESPITERLTMVIATPMKSVRSELVGVLAARLNLSQLFELVGNRTGLGDTGETIVAELVGDEIVFIAPTRHDAMAAFERRVPANDGQWGLGAATRGQDGSGQLTDYRGECTLAAWQSVPSLGWGLVTKIDCDEALAPVQRGRFELSVLAALLSVVAVLAAFILAQGLVRPLRALKAATDRISKGDVDVQLDIRSGDEIGDLAESFERMVAAIKFFREHSYPEDEEPPDDDAAPDHSVGADSDDASDHERA